MENVSVKIKRKDNPQEYVFAQNLSNTAYKSSRRVWFDDYIQDNLFDKRFKPKFDYFVSNFKFDRSGASDNTLECDMSFKRVKTSGPVVGLLGYYLDVASGYVLMSKVKTTDYIPLFDLYGALEERGLVINPEVMLALLERYKLGTINFEEFIEELIKVDIESSDRSYIGQYLKKMEEDNIKAVGDLDKQEFVNLFHYITQYLYMFENPSGDLFNYEIGKRYMNIEKNSPGLGDYIRGFLSTKEGLSDANRGVFKNDYDIVGSGPKDKWTGSTLLAMSAMGHVDKNKTDIKQMNKTTALALNLYDITDEMDTDVSLESTIDSYMDGEIDKDMIEDVISKIGADSYLKGRDMSNMVRGLTNDTTKKYIDLKYKKQVWLDKIKNNFSPMDNKNKRTMVSDDFDRLVRVMRKVFKRIDKLV